ncbi:MAG: hypothetical protein ABJG47_16555 [Ekhidna sp.]
MRQLLVGLFILATSLLYAQSYIDSGIRHFAAGEYDEALIDFKDAEEIESMITESSKAKLYYYRGIIWLNKAESAVGFAEEDPLQMSFQDLTQVLSMDPDWEPQIKKAYEKLHSLILDEAEDYTKLARKEEALNGQLSLLDTRIGYLQMAEKLEVSTRPILLLGQTNKYAGDLLFDNAGNDLTELKKSRKYYEKALQYYEIARYDDPFSKEIIEELLLISRRLTDAERIEEYEKLLELAGG